MKQSINIMLQKWINPLKVPVSTFYIITFINCSLTSQRSMIWSRVNRGHRQTNPGTGAHADVLSPFPARHCRGISLNHVSSTGFSWVKHPRAPQLLTAQGLVWWGSTDNTTDNHSWKHRGRYLVPYWENAQTATEGESWLVTALADNGGPIFIYTDTRACCSTVLWTLFGISCLIGTAPVCVPDISLS